MFTMLSAINGQHAPTPQTSMIGQGALGDLSVSLSTTGNECAVRAGRHEYVSGAALPERCSIVSTGSLPLAQSAVSGREIEAFSEAPITTVLPGHMHGPKSYKKSSLGEHFNLFQANPGQPTDRLIVTAHGGYFPGIHTTVPEGTTLVFYVPDGKLLEDPGVANVVSGWVVPFEEKAAGSSVRDYRLAKFHEDSYQLIQEKLVPTDDILTVRNRKAPTLIMKNSMISLENIFQELKLKGISYKEIHLNICRGSGLNPFAGDYTAPVRPPVTVGLMPFDFEVR